MQIPEGHRDRASSLLPWLARIFEAEGVAVVIHDGEENSVRSRQGGGFEVVAQGVPNLLHEALHALQAGVIADDHGIDYSRIPFDVSEALGRRMLWEELACAAVSCAYLDDPAAVDPWFAEQIEIQGVFFGFADEDLAGLRGFIEATVTAWPGEVEAAVQRAHALLKASLREVGAPEALAEGRMESFAALWARYRRGWSSGENLRLSR